VAWCTRKHAHTAATRCPAALGILFSSVLIPVDHVDRPSIFFFVNSYITLFICPMQLNYSRRYLQIHSRQPVNRVAWQKIFLAGLAPMQDTSNYSACKYVAGRRPPAPSRSIPCQKIFPAGLALVATHHPVS
jgi:hypothetical protein